MPRKIPGHRKTRVKIASAAPLHLASAERKVNQVLPQHALKGPVRTVVMATVEEPLPGHQQHCLQVTEGPEMSHDAFGPV